MSDLYEDTTGKVRGLYASFPVFDGIVICPDWFLDSHVYGVCETCGGSRWITRPEEDESGQEPPSDWERVPCPDCTTVSVVTKELWEQAGRMFWERTRQLRVDELNAVEWEDLSPVRRIELMEEADHILSTVLGKVRAAREVGEFCAGNRETGESAYLDIPGSLKLRDIDEGDTIAILEDDYISRAESGKKPITSGKED